MRSKVEETGKLVISDSGKPGDIIRHTFVVRGGYATPEKEPWNLNVREGVTINRSADIEEVESLIRALRFLKKQMVN